MAGLAPAEFVGEVPARDALGEHAEAAMTDADRKPKKENVKSVRQRIGKCYVCGRVAPLIPHTDLCGPCCFGTAEELDEVLEVGDDE